MFKFVTIGFLAAVLTGCLGGSDIGPDAWDAGAGNAGGGGGSGACVCELENDGTRLSRKFLIGADGSKMTTAFWFDKQLNDDCVFQSLANGETRCVPPAISLNTFIDSACTIPAWISKNDCDEMPNYVRIEHVVSKDVCGEIVDVEIDFRKVDPGLIMSGVPNFYSFDGDGQCSGAGGVPSNWKIYGTIPLYNVSWFVEAVQGVGF